MAKTVFFDMFDTLVRVDRGVLEDYFTREIDRMGDMGQIDARQTIDELFKGQDSMLQKAVEMAPGMEQVPESEKLERLKAALTSYYMQCMETSMCNIDPEIIKMLDSLKEAGFKLCIISDAAFTDIAAWERSPLRQYFDGAVFSCQEHIVKPDPRLWEMAMERMHCGPEESIYVGDGGHDELMAAKRVGMTTIRASYFKDRDVKTVTDHQDWVSNDPVTIARGIEVLARYSEVTKNMLTGFAPASAGAFGMIPECVAHTDNDVVRGVALAQSLYEKVKVSHLLNEDVTVLTKMPERPDNELDEIENEA